MDPSFSYLLGLVIVACAWMRRNIPFWPPPVERFGARRTLAITCALGAVLVAAFFVEGSVLERALRMQSPAPPWMATIPLLYLSHTSPYRPFPDPLLISVAQICALVECGALYALFRVLRDGEASRGTALALGATAGMLAVVALAGHAMGSNDLYLYLGAALEPTPYHPTSVPFGGEQSVINTMWGLPIFAIPYGPLWVGLSKLAIAGTHTLYAQLTALRVLTTIAIAASVASLAAARRPFPAIALFAVNPAIYALYVRDGHNDIVGVAFVLGAVALRERPWLAVPVAALAGMVKLPFILVGMLAFSERASFAKRVRPAVCACVLSVALTFALAGPEYPAALRGMVQIFAKPVSGYEFVLHALLALVALGAIAGVLVARKYVGGFAWSFPALSQFTLQQYMGWGIPYALSTEGPAALFLIFLPLASYFLSTDFDKTPIVVFLRPALLLGMLALAVLSLRVTRPGTDPKRGAPAASAP